MRAARSGWKSGTSVPWRSNSPGGCRFAKSSSRRSTAHRRRATRGNSAPRARSRHRANRGDALDLERVVESYPRASTAARPGDAFSTAGRRLLFKTPARLVGGQPGVALVAVVDLVHVLDGVEVADDVG